MYDMTAASESASTAHASAPHGRNPSRAHPVHRPRSVAVRPLSSSNSALHSSSVPSCVEKTRRYGVEGSAQGAGRIAHASGGGLDKGMDTDTGGAGAEAEAEAAAADDAVPATLMLANLGAMAPSVGG